MTEISEDPKVLAKELGVAADAPIGTAQGIAAIALNMAMKYHGINTVQDGTLYQQYKLEGRNMRELNIDMVFETAIKIERHIVFSQNRVAAMLFEAMAEVEELDAADASLAGGSKAEPR